MANGLVEPVTEKHLSNVSFDSVTCNREKTAEQKLAILAGPMLRYWGRNNETATWRGSVSYVVRDSESNYNEMPVFMLNGDKLPSPTRFAQIRGISFFRFDLELEMPKEAGVEVKYCWGEEHPEYAFVVPGMNETMRSMFYSCNGLSLSADPKDFPASLWKDVMRNHETSPYHLMLGGGDQLYCDSIRCALPDGLFSHSGELQNEEKYAELIDAFYLKQYTLWFGQGFWEGPLGQTKQKQWVDALATIPSINIYDDHDIIDGYGTYDHHTMKRPVFRLLGEYAYRYYMLFQQNTHWETDAKLQDPSWICTNKLGPYIHHPARSIYAQIGPTAAVLGLDCRTERTRHCICTPDLYAAMFERLTHEVRANKGIQHIYLILGVPIAYPRMVWAERLMESNAIKPITWLSKKKIAFKGLVNPFDGQVELLDDLNDHWASKCHKKERNEFLQRLLDFQLVNSVRITILSGDVHLCAVGTFQSIVPVAPEKDANFMVCPVSSAITNGPPPTALADFLNRRNHKHIFRAKVLERLIPIFNKDVNGEELKNKSTMARRNYLTLESVPEGKAPKGKVYAGPAFGDRKEQKFPPKHDKYTECIDGSLHMVLNVEVNPKDDDAKTVPYDMYIPPLSTEDKYDKSAPSRSLY